MAESEFVYITVPSEWDSLPKVGMRWRRVPRWRSRFKDGLKLIAVITIVLFTFCLTAEGDE